MPADKFTLKPPGLVGDIARWIDECSSRHAPMLSLGASLCAVATLCGRRYAMKGGLRPVLYVVGCAQSGVGKEVGRQCAITILNRSGLGQRVGTSGFASGAGLVQRMRGCPIQLFLLDEFGRVLQGFNSRNAANHERQVVTTLMELWGCASGTFLGAAYAEKDAPKVEQPHCVLYATTTPDSFAAAIGGRDIVDGVLSRMLLLQAEHGPQPLKEPTAASDEPPAELVERCMALADGWGGGGNLRMVESADMRTLPDEVALGWGVKERILECDAEINRRGTNMELWTRALEQTKRVGLTVALGQGKRALDLVDFEWAWALVRWSIKKMMALVADEVAESEEERCALRIMKAVRAAGGELSLTEITKAVHHAPRVVRENALRTLLDGERLVSDSRVNARTDKLTRWYRIPSADDASPFVDDPPH